MSTLFKIEVVRYRGMGGGGGGGGGMEVERKEGGKV